MTTSNGRAADHPIDPMFLERWSPRTATREKISDADLFTMFEAARWAPSSSNLQPWRFLYAKRDTPEWQAFLEPLTDGNKRWVPSTSVLVAVLSKRMVDAKGDKPARESYTHSFDTGAAWAYLALQASVMGFFAHGMSGFDPAKAIETLHVPDDYRIECFIAIGRYAPDPENPVAPNSRSPQTSFVREGLFKA